MVNPSGAAGSCPESRKSWVISRVSSVLVVDRPSVPTQCHRQAAPGSLLLIETMLALLTEGGHTGTDRVVAQRTLIGYLLGFLQNEHYAALSGAGTGTMSELPPERYPHLAGTAADARTLPPAEEFRRGLDIVLRGLGG